MERTATIKEKINNLVVLTLKFDKKTEDLTSQSVVHWRTEPNMWSHSKDENWKIKRKLSNATLAPKYKQ